MRRHPSIRLPHSPLAAVEVRTSSPCLLPDLTKKVLGAPGQHSINALLYHCQTLWVASPMASTVSIPLLHIDIEKPQLLANQPDIVVVDKEQKTAVVIDMAIPADSNIMKKEHEKIEKYQGLKEQLEHTWKVKSKVVPVVIRALCDPQLGEWLQQIPGVACDVSVQKSAVRGTTKILCRTLKFTGLWKGT
ncbi:uncharacterized protein LOC106513546 [Tachysurus ichikawai]